MKKLLLTLVSLCCVSTAFAGGILTNTNQSAHFIRMVARDASLQIDGAYTNPAGLVKLNDGFHFSLTNQSVFQTRTINSTFPGFQGWGGSDKKEFEGKASAPIVPSFQAAYKTGKWVLSGGFAITGGGGKATFNDGLPSFESQLSIIPGIVSGLGIPTTQYSVDAYMTGASYIYGAQIGGSYAFTDIFSGYAGFRLNIVNNHYKGHLRNFQINPNHPLVNPGGGMMSGVDFFTAIGQPTFAGMVADREIDSKQSGWGISPIIGFNANYKKWNVGMKYEFRTALNTENKTVINKDAGLEQFKDGVNTPHDIPSLFTVGVSYQITPKLLASVGYHHFFDSEAAMAEIKDPANPTQMVGKEKYISGGTDEYLGGAEFQINDMFLISAGGQITRYGVKDEYQSDLSFSINSYSVGLGGAVKVAKNVVINVGYFWTTYSDWNKKNANYVTNPVTGAPIAGTDKFSRTNKVFAAGVDFSF